jgi:hypothetical protein
MCHTEQLENQTEKEHKQIAEDHKAPYNEGHKPSWDLKKEKPQVQNSQFEVTNQEARHKTMHHPSNLHHDHKRDHSKDIQHPQVHQKSKLQDQV